jgi:DNA-binding transcriptional LysR family regulator
MTSKVDRLQLITTFLAIAEAGNISAAARALGTTQPTVSRRLRDLEHLLGSRLASRSTRGFYLTAEGEELQRRAASWADVWSEWEHVLKTTSGLPRGKLTLAAPQGYGDTFLMEAIAQFRAEFPEVEVDLRLTDRPVDIVGQGIDCWVRVGGSRDQGLHVRRIGQMRRILVASSTLARRYKIAQPEDLASVPFVGLVPHVHGRLTLISVEGAQRTVTVTTPVTTDSLLASYRAIQNGLGVGGSGLWLYDRELKAGRMRRILPKWELTPISIEVVSVAGRFRPARINAFVEILQAAMSKLNGFVPA